MFKFLSYYRINRLLAWLVFIPLVAFANPSSKDIDTKVSLQQVVTDADNRISLGLKVLDISNNQVIFEKNPGRTYTPASNQKIVTAAAGLLYLGPNYRFKTQLFREMGSIESGQLHGNVVIKFAGDPELRISHLKQLIKALADQEGIRQIHGDVIIDESVYGGQDLGPGWMWEDMRHCFSAPISANILNQNCAGIRIAPGKKVGEPVTILPTDTSPYVSIINHAVTNPANARHCNIKLSIAPKNQYVLEGCMNQSSKALGLSVSLDDPDRFNTGVIKNLFQGQQIEIIGKIKDGRAKGELKLIAEHTSAPLSQFVREMLKESDNLISDTIFKKLGATYFKGQGTWKTGSKAVRRILAEKLGIDPYVGVVADGSGLSRYNLVSPEQIVELLNRMYHYPKSTVKEAFITALPMSGIDGTLEHRLTAPGLIGKVKAKTGTMANVTSLSGFIYTKSNKVLAFSIITNGIAGSTRQYKVFEDQICELLIDGY